MKKLTLAAIFLFMGFAAKGQAHVVQASILKFLQAEGYEAGIDEDDDFVFTNNNYSYIVYVDDKDSDGFYYIRMVSLFKVCDMPEMELLRVANIIHNDYKLVTVYFSENEDQTLALAFETGCFVTTAAEFTKVLKRHLSCLETGMKFYFNYEFADLEEEEEELEEEGIILMYDLSDCPA